MEKHIEMIKRFRQISWASNLGTSALAEMVELVSDYDQMKMHIDSDDWSNTVVNKVGDMTAYITKNYRERGRDWNKIVQYTKDNYISELDTVLKDKGIEDKSVRDDIEYNVINIIMASYYSDIYEDSFWNNLYEVYAGGHIACGFYSNTNKFLAY